MPVAETRSRNTTTWNMWKTLRIAQHTFQSPWSTRKQVRQASRAPFGYPTLPIFKWSLVEIFSNLYTTQGQTFESRFKYKMLEVIHLLYPTCNNYFQFWNSFFGLSVKPQPNKRSNWMILSWKRMIPYFWECLISRGCVFLLTRPPEPLFVQTLTFFFL